MDAPASSVEGGGEGQGQVEGNARAPLQALKTSLVQTRARLTKSLRGNFKKLMQQLLDKDSDSSEEDGQDDAPPSPALWDIDSGSLLPIQLQHGACMHGNADSRRAVWLEWSSCHQDMAALYTDLLGQELPGTVIADVAKDCHRTFPSYKRFAASEGQVSLRNILQAYAAYDDAVAYCQGMNFVAGCLLMFLPKESEAFGALVTLMKDRGLAGLYGNSMPLLQEQLWQLGQLLSSDLAAHMEVCGVVPVHFAASWLMTCFAADFPMSFAARVLDVLLSGSLQAAMLKVALTLLQAVEQELLAMHDMEDILFFLKTTVPGWAEPRLHDILQQAFSTGWTAAQLAQLNCVDGKESVAQSMERIARAALDGSSPRAYHPQPSPLQSQPGSGVAPLPLTTRTSASVHASDPADAQPECAAGNPSTELQSSEAAPVLDVADAELRATVTAPIHLGTSLGAYPAAELLCLHSSGEMEKDADTTAPQEQEGVGARLTLGSFGTPSRLRLSSGVSFADGCNGLGSVGGAAGTSSSTPVAGERTGADSAGLDGLHPADSTLADVLQAPSFSLPPSAKGEQQLQKNGVEGESTTRQVLFLPPDHSVVQGSSNTGQPGSSSLQQEQPAVVHTAASPGVAPTTACVVPPKHATGDSGLLQPDEPEHQQAGAVPMAANENLQEEATSVGSTEDQNAKVQQADRTADRQVGKASLASNEEQQTKTAPAGPIEGQQAAAHQGSSAPSGSKPASAQLTVPRASVDPGLSSGMLQLPNLPPPIELNWDDPRLVPEPGMLANSAPPPAPSHSTAAQRPSALQTFASGPGVAVAGMGLIPTTMPHSPFSCFLQQGMLPQPPTPKVPMDEADEIWQHLVGSGPSGPSPSSSVRRTWGNAMEHGGYLPCYTPSTHSQGMDGLPQGEQLPHGASTRSSSMLDVLCEQHAEAQQRRQRHGSGDWSNISSGTLTRASSVQLPNGTASSEEDSDVGVGNWYNASGAGSTAGRSRGVTSTAAASVGGYGASTGAAGQDATNELHLAGEILRALCAQQLEQQGAANNSPRSLRSTTSRHRRATSVSASELGLADGPHPGTAASSQNPSANSTLGQPMRLSAVLGAHTDVSLGSGSKESQQPQHLQLRASRGTSYTISPRSTCSNITAGAKAAFMHTAPASPTHPQQRLHTTRAQCSVSTGRASLGPVVLNRTGSQPLSSVHPHPHDPHTGHPDHAVHEQGVLGSAASGSPHGTMHQPYRTLLSFISSKMPISPKLRVMISDDHGLAAPASTPSRRSCDGHHDQLHVMSTQTSEATTPCAGLTAHPPLPPKHASARACDNHSTGLDAAAHNTLHGRSTRSISGAGATPLAAPYSHGHMHAATCSQLGVVTGLASQQQQHINADVPGRLGSGGVGFNVQQQSAMGGPFASRQLQAHLLDSFTASVTTANKAGVGAAAGALPVADSSGQGMVSAECLAGSPGCTTRTVGSLASNKTLPASISYQ